MNVHLILYSWLAGLSVLLGGALAHIFISHVRRGALKQYVIHSFMALGAGILLAAVGLVLIPHGIDALNLPTILVSFLLGLGFFAWLDGFLAARGGQFATLMAMLMDFIPEALALGALFAVAPQSALLLAVFIAMQNIPEAFNAYLDLRALKLAAKPLLWLFFALSGVGVVAALIGTHILAAHLGVNAALMVFASGGILYIVFNDLAPAIDYQKSPLPPIFAALGFLLGVIGAKVV